MTLVGGSALGSLWLYVLGFFGAAASVVIFPGLLVWLITSVMGSQLASIGAVHRLFGRSSPRLSLLLFFEALDPGVAATLLTLESDDVAASVLSRVSPRFMRKVLAKLAPLRRESLEYWLDHPQPFPRSQQQAVARRLKRALEQAG